MSISRFTDWSIECNHPGCPMQVWVSEIDLRTVTNATTLRKILKRRGWTVNVPAADVPGFHMTRRLDYCPDHKPQAA